MHQYNVWCWFAYIWHWHSNMICSTNYSLRIIFKDDTILPCLPAFYYGDVMIDLFLVLHRWWVIDEDMTMIVCLEGRRSVHNRLLNRLTCLRGIVFWFWTCERCMQMVILWLSLGFRLMDLWHEPNSLHERRGNCTIVEIVLPTCITYQRWYIWVSKLSAGLY